MSWSVDVTATQVAIHGQLNNALNAQETSNAAGTTGGEQYMLKGMRLVRQFVKDFLAANSLQSHTVRVQASGSHTADQKGNVSVTVTFS